MTTADEVVRQLKAFAAQQFRKLEEYKQAEEDWRRTIKALKALGVDVDPSEQASPLRAGAADAGAGGGPLAKGRVLSVRIPRQLVRALASVDEATALTVDELMEKIGNPNRKRVYMALYNMRAKGIVAGRDSGVEYKGKATLAWFLTEKGKAGV